MDLRTYFQKIKKVESTIADLFTLVISLETRDGGVAGTPTEVSRSLAAKMIVDGFVRLAEPQEKDAFYKRQPVQAPANPPAAVNPPASANTQPSAKK